MNFLILIAAFFLLGTVKGDATETNPNVVETIIEWIEDKTSANQTLLNDLISTLNSASLSEYIINLNGKQSVNFTLLSQNYIYTLPPLWSYINQHILSTYASNIQTYMNQTLGNTVTAIQNTLNNSTIQTVLAGYLYINGLAKYVSCGPTVDFFNLIGDSSARSVLNEFIENYEMKIGLANHGFGAINLQLI